MLIRFVVLCLVLWTGVGSQAYSQTGLWDESFEFSRVRLIAAKSALDGSKDVTLGLEFDVADGWNIYWRTPGSVGLPPVLAWKDSSQIVSSDIQWPLPERYTYALPGSEDGIESMVYRGRTILPLHLSIANPTRPLVADAVVDYMVCSDICIFGQANVRLDLFVGDHNPPLSEHAPRINEFASRVPQPNGADVSLGLREHHYDPQSKNLVFELVSMLPLERPDILVEAPGEGSGFAFGRPEFTLSQDKKTARVVVPVQESPLKGETIKDVDLRLTLVDAQRGVDLGFVRIGTAQGLTTADWALGVNTEAGAASEEGRSMATGGVRSPGWTGLALVLAALAAGVILNFMPCVLPVLSLKMMAFIGKSDQESASIRKSFLATALGIILSFWILATLVLLLQRFGVAIGWGFQFQSPYFSGSMMAVMVLFAANMFGWFTLPTIPGLGAIGAGKRGLSADFMTGALATLLATPCSAPLLAPVVGIAFAGDTGTILWLFTLIGIGMAAPYWLVVLFPSLARFLPKPGPWMVFLKAVLGMLLLAFALYLIWVLMTQLGAWVAGLAFVLSSVVLLFLFVRKQQSNALLPILASFVILGGIPVASANFLPNHQIAWLTPSPSGNDIQWLDFDETQAAELVAQGRTVFVDVTASWCINCQVNKAVALGQSRVQQALKEANVVLMVADWTNHDPEIANYLAKYSRAAIPFNIVYSPKNPNGQVLPTVLTPEAVLRALE